MAGGWDRSESHFQATPDKLSRKDLARRAASDSSPGGFSHPQVVRLSQILSQAPCGRPLHSLFSPRELSPAQPQVATQSPPPRQPRERTVGTEFNRHQQQPPGKPRKVDTLIPVPVSGEQAQGRSLFLLGEGCWGPTPHCAGPLPGRCHGDGPYRKQLGCFQKASQLWAPKGMGC